jgi:SAM-dependent methyltransferase
MADLRAIWDYPSAYSWLRKTLSGNASDVFQTQYIKACAGDRVLDIGCGPADILESLPQVDYVGFDGSERYIAQAQRRFLERGKFYHKKISATVLAHEEPFDVVLALGVIHHLSDDEARGLLQLVKRLLRPGGRFVSADPCFCSNQSRASRLFASWDRGDYVRQSEEQASLMQSELPGFSTTVREDMLRYPCSLLVTSYTHNNLQTDSKKDQS